MKRSLLILLNILLSLSAMAGRIVIADRSADNQPVAGASVISSRGIILGATDAGGGIDVAESDFPLSIRCMGYEPLTAGTIADTIFLTTATYTLAELEVTPTDRPVTRAVAYAREYTTGATPSDTLQMLGEYMIEFFYADEKLKGYSDKDNRPFILTERRYGRTVRSAEGVDSVMRPTSDDEVTAFAFLQYMASLPYKNIEETEALRLGALTDTVHGKYYPRYIYRKTPSLFTTDFDGLSEHKGHKWSPWFFKLFGMTMELQHVNRKESFRLSETGKYGLNDFIFGIYNVHLLGKGRLIKKYLNVKDPIGVDCYMELYPVEIEHLTVDEYKELKKNCKERKQNFVTPANLQPLPPSIQLLLDRIEREQPSHAGK